MMSCRPATFVVGRGRAVRSGGGATVGAGDGDAVGASVGVAVGSTVGVGVGLAVGTTVVGVCAHAARRIANESAKAARIGRSTEQSVGLRGSGSVASCQRGSGRSA